MKHWEPKVVTINEYLKYMFGDTTWHRRDMTDTAWDIWLKYTDGKVYRLDHATGRLFTEDGVDKGHGVTLTSEYLIYGNKYRTIVIGGE